MSNPRPLLRITPPTYSTINQCSQFSNLEQQQVNKLCKQEITMWSRISASNSKILREMHPKRRSTFLFVFFLGLTLIGFFISYAAFAQNAEYPTLISVHVVFRHGARTPSSSYPNDPYSNKIWPDGFGSLTNLGKSQLHNLGQFFRKKYGNFLGERYNGNELNVKSSYSPRAQMSALTFLAGLFPPVSDQIWNPSLHWQPIPVNQIPRHLDTIIAARAPCKAFSDEKLRSDAELNTKIYNENKDLFKIMSEKSGHDIKTIDEAEQLYYVLSIQEDNNLKMPEWAKVIQTQMATIAGLNLASFTLNDRLKKFQSGPLLKEWLGHFKEPDRTKLYLYSGHDTTIVNIMRTLGFHENFLPKYGAAVVAELHIEKTTNNTFLKFLYLNSSSSTEFIDLNLPQCSPTCFVEDFALAYDKFIPRNWTQECEN